MIGRCPFSTYTVRMNRKKFGEGTMKTCYATETGLCLPDKNSRVSQTHGPLTQSFPIIK